MQKLGLRKESIVDIGQKAREFAEYLRLGMSGPHYSYDVSDAIEIDCPSVQLVRVALMKELHLTDAEIMDRPWALCKWDHVTLKALAGQIRMTDRDEIKEAQELANRLFEQLNPRHDVSP